MRIQLGTSSSNAADYCLVYNYYSGSNPTSCAVPSPATGNNGNVMGYWYNDSVSPSLSHAASYGYDSLNRLATAAATKVGSGTNTYNQSFTLDRYGNMECSGCGYTFNAATNQNTSYSYDAAASLPTASTPTSGTPRGG